VRRPLSIELRDPRIPGGRLAISAGTGDPVIRDAYRASILAALDTDLGDDVVARLRLTKGQRGKLTPAQVHAAVRSYDLTSLVASAADESRHRIRPAQLGEVADRFMRHIISDRAEGTAERYAGYVRSLELAMGVQRDRAGRIVQDVEVRGITREQAIDWLKGRKATTGRPWSPRSQTVAGIVAQQLWALAIVEEEDQASERDLPWKPWRNLFAADRQRPQGTVRPPRVLRTRHAFLTRRAAARLLRATRGTRYAAWVAVGFLGGLRISEAIYLRVGIDVDLDAGELRIQDRRGDYPWRPKGGKPREVPINSALARYLRAHIREGYAGERYLFRQPGEDRPLSMAQGARWTRDAFASAGIEYGGRKSDSLTYHSLRHTFGSWLATQGISPAAIADLMGNTVDVVLSTYVHLYPGEKKRAVERMRRKPIR